MMTTAQYFSHIRSLGAFPAAGALELARKAVEMDNKAAAKCSPSTAVVWHEILPDGSVPLKLSHGVKVY